MKTLQGLALLLALTGAGAAPLPSGPPAPPAGPIALPPRPASAPASVPSPAVVAPLVDLCPAQLPVHQAVAQDIAGWTAVNEQASYPFARVAFYPATPPEAGRMVPTQEFNTRGGLHDAWDLPRRPEGYRVTCSYGNTTATLTRKLPDNVDFCQADYDGRFLTLVVKHWSCGDRRVLQPSARPPAPVRPVQRPAPRAPAPARAAPHPAGKPFTQ